MKIKSFLNAVGVGLLIPLGINACPLACTEEKLMTVTAYCSCYQCCGRWSQFKTTASGHKIKPGDKFCAADPSIPFGTMIDIPGYGRVPVLDRGGAIRKGRLDVYFDSHSEAKAWGRKALMVKVG